MAQGVPVALLSSLGADARLQRLGFSAWSDLFTPFSETSIEIKDPHNGATTVPSKITLDFRDLRRQGYLLSLTVLPPTLQEALLTCCSLDECEQKFTRYFHRFIEPSEYETFRTYVACVFVIAGCEEQPLSELSKLIQMQHTQQHGSASDGNMLAPSHCASPKWRTPTTLKHYLLVHDCSRDDENRSQDIYRQMCSTYGADCCHLLKIGSGDGTGLMDVWLGVAEEELVVARGLTRARRELLTKSSDGENKENSVGSSVATISPSYAMAASPSSVPLDTPSDSGLTSPVEFQRNVSATDRESIRGLMQDFSDKNLVPYVERLMRNLIDQIGQRRGIPRSLTAGMKKWFGAPIVTQTAPVSYANESVEMQSRRLADLMFEFGLYEKAHQQYQAVKKEFATDNAILHHAAALDMAAYSLFLSNISIGAKNFPVRYFENALTIFLNNTVPYTATLRCALHASEILARLELNVDAAMQLVRITQLDIDHSVGVCLARAAAAFEQSGMHRKTAFYRVLAGNRFIKSELVNLAMDCYRAALPQYFEKNWDHAEDHICEFISRNCSHPKVAASCATRLLRAADHQSAQQQADFLARYVSTLKKFSLDATCPVNLHLPIVELASTVVIYGDRPSTEAVRCGGSGGSGHEWEDIQRAAFHTLAGPSSAFHALCVVSDSDSDNTRRRETPAGERFRVLLNVVNPLAIPLCLRDVSVGMSEVEWRDGEGAEQRNPFSEVAVLPEINLAAGEKTVIELWVRPCVELAYFRVSEVLFRLDSGRGDCLRGRIPVSIRGKRLNKTAKQKKEKLYAEDRRLEASVSCASWPLLDVELERPLPTEVYCGQAVRMFIKLQNIGSDTISGVCVSTDAADCVCGGTVDHEGRRVPVLSDVSSNNARVRAVPFPGVVLSKGDVKRVFIDIRAPMSPIATAVALTVFYQGAGGACREERMQVPMNPTALLSARARLLDPLHGLVSLDLRNELPASDAALARIEIARVTARLAHVDASDRLVEMEHPVSLHPLRLRSVQLDCAQSDSFCVSVAENSEGLEGRNSLWLTSELPECPHWPLPLEVCDSPVSLRPILFLSALWKASIVNNKGHVTSFLGEVVVSDPFSTANERIPGIDWVDVDHSQDEQHCDSSASPLAVSISCCQLAPVVHDFNANRLCEIPLQLCVRNADRRPCSVALRFNPKLPLPFTPPLAADARQQWWVDREVCRIRSVPGCSTASITLRIRVAQPSVYDLLGAQVQATAAFENGCEFSIPVPAVHALVTSA